MIPSFHIRLGAALLLGAALGLYAGCYSAPYTAGWYRCENHDECGPGLVCDDGVCCDLEGSPGCPTLMRLDGTCAEGAAPVDLYADKDGDGFGDDSSVELYCALPVLQQFVTVGGDCLDTPGVGASAWPDAGELCDGLDNDCDGIEDDELPGQLYYDDSDNDGAGDPAVSRSFCMPPDGGWVVSSNDCDPARNDVSPAGTEVCDGLDNDCRNGVDDNPQGLAATCTSTAKGICAAGKEVCQAGAPVCQSTVAPREETCDTVLDEDCNGVVDNRPGCGGPTNLLLATVATKGAGGLAAGAGPGFTACQRGNLTGTDNVSGTNVWSGNGSNIHLFWVQKAGGGTWDLRRPSNKLRISFNAQVTINPATPPWNEFGQPIIMLCSKSGQDTRIRWANTGSAWMTASAGPYTASVPLDGSGTSWVRAVSGNLADVDRVEIMVQPNAPASGTPSFNVSWLELGFTGP